MAAYSYASYGRVAGMPSYPYPPTSTTGQPLGASAAGASAMGGLMAGAAGYCGSLGMGGAATCVSAPTGFDMMHPAMNVYGSKFSLQFYLNVHLRYVG